MSGQRQVKLRQNVTGKPAYELHSASACFRHTNPPVLIVVRFVGEYACQSDQIFHSGLGGLHPSVVLNIPNITYKVASEERVWCDLCSYLGLLTGLTRSNGHLGPLGTAYHVDRHNFLLSEFLTGLSFVRHNWAGYADLGASTGELSGVYDSESGLAWSSDPGGL